jgi:hypothetical protein
LFGKFFLVLLETFEHVVCARGHTVALFCKFFAAGGGHCSFRIVLRLSHIKVGGKISEWQQTVAMLGSPRWDCSEQPAALFLSSDVSVRGKPTLLDAQTRSQYTPC